MQEKKWQAKQWGEDHSSAKPFINFISTKASIQAVLFYLLNNYIFVHIQQGSSEMLKNALTLSYVILFSRGILLN